jgi:hypothetical protein
MPLHIGPGVVSATFAQLTHGLLLSADVIVAVDARDASLQLSIYPPPHCEMSAAVGTVRILVVAIDPAWRDEQVSELRSRPAAIRPVRAGDAGFDG